MAAQELNAIAKSIVADHKGVLAADESTGTIKKRFDAIGVESTEENRRAYRNLLFTTPGSEEYVGGVILYDETIRQAADDGTPFPELLASKGVVPGIKVDLGAQDLAGHPGEKVTEGLDGLRARFAEYHGLGARFSKWRAVITIGDGIPTDACLHVNAHALARYAALSQEAGIVPIVEPEVLMDADNSIETLPRGDVAAPCTLVFEELDSQASRARGHAPQAEHGDLRQGLPDPGLGRRGGRADDRLLPPARAGDGARDRVPLRRPVRGQATENLNAINRVGGPWPLSFSYGRALQASALEAWRGDPASVEAGQDAFLHRARMNALAAAGDWSAELEEAVPA